VQLLGYLDDRGIVVRFLAEVRVFFSSPQQSGREVDQPLSDARVKNERSRAFLGENLHLPQ